MCCRPVNDDVVGRSHLLLKRPVVESPLMSNQRESTAGLPAHAFVPWLASAASLALMPTSLADWAPILGSAAMLWAFVAFIGQRLPKGILRRQEIMVPQVGAMMVALVVSVSQASWSNPYLVSVPVLLGLMLVLRFGLFRWLNYTSAWWIEVLLLLGVVPCYVVGALRSSRPYLGWLGLVPILAFTVVGAVMVTQRQFVMMRKAKSAIGVGETAPDFRLESHRNEWVSLSDFRGVRPVLLFFVRGDWCPGCHIMLRSYERNRAKFIEKNTAILAIGPDPTGVNREIVEALGLEFGLLTDTRMEVARKYRVLLEGPQTGVPYDEGMPLPASFLIDAEGIIRFSSRADQIGSVLQPDAIFPVLDAIPAARSA